MVAERRERKAAPTSWVQPEPAGKGKPVGSKKKAPAKKKQPQQQPVKPLSATAPAQPFASSSVSATPVTLQDESMYAAQGQQEQGYGQHSVGDEMSLGNGGASSTTQHKGGAGPVETETGEQLFCICMGVDNGTPMIFCEACENWFHFECIGLSEEDASRIATYYCDMCEQAGAGKTEWSYDAPSTFDELPSFATEGPPSSPPPVQKLPQGVTATSQLSGSLPPIPVPPVMTPSDSGDDADNADDGDYFASRQGASEGDDATQTLSKVVESDDDDDDYEEGNTSKRKKKESSASIGTSRLPPLSAPGAGGQRRKSSSAGAGNAAKRRKRVVEDEEEAEERRKKAASSANQFYGSTAKAGPSSSNPLSNPTRKHCIEQLEKILEAIFTSAASTSTQENSTISPSRAREYGEAVEKELFTHNSELDAKGNLTHSKKYTAKFRTLHFNLKSNDYFRSRVASGQLDAFAIYSMNQEDLLSPEVRAEQEAEKLRSLAQSVKVATVQPKTKITHKGEEVLDEYDAGTNTTGETERNDNVDDLRRRDSMSTSVMGDTPYIPNEGFDSFSERERSMSLAGSPRLEHSPRFGSPSASTSMPVFTDSPTGRAFSPVEEFSNETAAASPDKTTTTAEESEEFARPSMPHHSRSDSQSKVKLDLDAVWSNLKPAQTASASPEKEEAEATQPKEKEEDDMDMESDDGSGEDKKAPEEVVEEYDPFATDNKQKGNADDEFDALMGGNEASQEKQQSSKPANLEATSTTQITDTAIANLPSVWEGQFNIPDESSFPVRLVQVGGTPFAPHPSIWDRILPKGKIDISGRIDEKAASEYVVQSNFSQSRENVVLAILPHIPPTPSTVSGPEQAAQLEKAEAAYAKLVKFYSERKRYGVAPPSGELKKVAKDHYIVPLKRDRALPDYIEILDSHVLPDKGSRQRDYLLSVLVLQKGLGLNTTPRTKSGGSTPQSSSQEHSASHHTANHLQPPQASTSHLSPLGQTGMVTPIAAFSTNMSPPYQPPGVPLQAPMGGHATPGPAIDTAALQSLLSNPSLLQALSAGSTTQGSPVPPPVMPQYGAFSPPPPSAFQGGIPGLAGPPVPPGVQPWAAPQPSQAYGAFPPQPPPGQWNPAGSPPWQGQQQGPPQPWNAPPHPPGYIDPERIKAASAEARLIAERDRQEKARRERGGGSGDGAYDYSRGARGGRDRSDRTGYQGDDRGGRGSRGRNRDSQQGPSSRKSEAGMNQMQAGISDRGWGRRAQ